MILFFTYHQVRPGDGECGPEFYTVSRGQFARHLDALAARKISCVAPSALLETGGATGPRCVLSFDDATRDHYEVVFPLLRERGLSAVFFVPTAKLNRPGYLTGTQVLELARGGQTIGLHGHDHNRLDLLNDAEIRHQIGHSRLVLRELTGERPWIFAPPGGFYNEHVREVAHGFGAQLIRTMRWGYNRTLDLGAMETIPVNRYTNDEKMMKIIEGRSARFVYLGKQAMKALVPGRAYERLRSQLFRLQRRN
jgi:peptidoglycan/xylan/chitin deacetylase (PgdA/CDA1 family)